MADGEPTRDVPVTPSDELDAGGDHDEDQLVAGMVDPHTLDFLHDLTRDAQQEDHQAISSIVQRCGMLLAFTGLTVTLAGKDLLPHLSYGRWHDVYHHEFYIFLAAIAAGMFAVATGVLALLAMRPITAQILSPRQIFIEHSRSTHHEAKFDVLNTMVQTQALTRSTVSAREGLSSWAAGTAVATLVLTLLAATPKAML